MTEGLCVGVSEGVREGVGYFLMGYSLHILEA